LKTKSNQNTTKQQVSVLSFGAWVTFGDRVDASAAAKIMRRARDAGVNFFDNAEVYNGGKAEEVMGEALRALAWPRSSFVLSTKVFWGGTGVNESGLSRKHVVEALDASLERLGISYVDVYLAHRPDEETPMEETVRAFNHVIEQGEEEMEKRCFFFLRKPNQKFLTPFFFRFFSSTLFLSLLGKALYWGTSEWSAAVSLLNGVVFWGWERGEEREERRRKKKKRSKNFACSPETFQKKPFKTSPPQPPISKSSPPGPSQTAWA